MISSRLLLYCFAFFVTVNSVYVFVHVEPLKQLLIASESLLTLVCSFLIANNLKKITKQDRAFLSAMLCLICIHVIVNPNTEFSTLGKICNTIIFFYTGVIINKNKTIVLNRNDKKNLLFSICLIPTLVLLIQILVGATIDEGIYSIFVNSNNFAYFSMVGSLLIFAFTGDQKKFWFYIFLNFSLSKTIGALLAIVLSTIYYFRSRILKPRILAFSLLFISGFLYLLLFSEIHIFLRLRNTFLAFSGILDNYSLKDMANVEFGDAINYASNEEDISFLFRIKHWSEIVTKYGQLDLINQLFGKGLGSIKREMSIKLVAHNDYLSILYQLGLLPSILLMSGYFKIILSFKKHFFFLPILSITIYYFTENLYENFIVSSLQFFLIGSYYIKTKSSENSSNK